MDLGILCAFLHEEQVEREKCNLQHLKQVYAKQVEAVASYAKERTNFGAGERMKE